MSYPHRMGRFACRKLCPKQRPAGTKAFRGRKEEALAGFQEIYRNNARFRNVPERIKALGGETD